MKEPVFKPEITFKDGVPLAPNVAPVIMLQVSDYDMGYQYAQQMNQIFGPWALERLKRKFTNSEAARSYLRCQAYARQVYESLVAPACKPTDLGLREWFGNWGQWETYPPPAA
jgi:hypothetical protein